MFKSSLIVLLTLVAFGVFANERPDIVVFLSDDHTWRDSSVYGSFDIETPNMARLAKAGMTFDKAYVASPSCAPSRAALLTGLYPANNGAEPNHSRPRPEIKKLPAYLQELGYEVVSFGKVGHYKQTPDYGFDVARHFNYHEDIAIPKALQWLEARDSKKPLCLFVGTNWPHVPWPEDIGDIDPAQLKIPPNHVSSKTTRKWRARYVAAIQKMDTELGQVYNLARKKLGDDTFFLHTSDHGAQWPFGKWNLYEDGIRTPMMVSWPGHIEGGTRSEAMVSWIDILPTLVDVAGGRKPEHIDGRSFLPVLEGKSDTHRQIIFTSHSGDGNNNVYPIRAAMTQDGWKYIRNLHPEFRFTSHVTKSHADSGYWQSWVKEAMASPEAKQTVTRYQQRPSEELYRITDDPYEQHNLIDDQTQVGRIVDLGKKVDVWMASTKDQKAIYGTPKHIAESGKPNIITVFIDDMGWSDLSCFGGKRVETENIDRLAAEGIKFSNFYVNSPICSPSRVALTTGQYPQRWKISSYLAKRKLNRERGMAQWLDPKAPVLARELRYAGYATGHFGKWHMGGQRDVGNAPLISKYGFDRSLTNFEGLGPRVLPLKDAYDGKAPRKHDLGSGDLGKGPIFWKDRSVITAEFVKEAVEFIDHAQVTGQPFYINLWPDDVHAPFFPPEVLRKAGDGSKRALYYAVLDAMDQQLGILFDRVRDDEKLKNNTLILIASDNGHDEGAGSSDPLRGAKTWLYEGGVRSPLIVWGPGLIDSTAAGTMNNESILCALDLNRSLYSLTGTPLPPGSDLDGENLIDTLLGKSKNSRQTPIFWRRPPDRPGTNEEDNPDLAARDGKWKLLINHDGSDPQLYDLNADISESRNLARENPDVVIRLEKAIRKWNAGLPLDASDPAFQIKSKKTKPVVSKKPHIIFLMADDLGWGDVGYHGSRIATPNIDNLAKRGVRLNHFYVQPVCSPTRGALMTGRYPMRLGLQCGVVRPWAAHGLPLDELTLPEALAKVGYKTAIVGKWHLGHLSADYLPTRRGFHQQYGHYNGALDYFTHIRDGGHDWHEDDKANYDEGYSTDLIGEQAVRIIAGHDKSEPLFLYVPFNAPHTPLQAPQEYIDQYSAMKKPQRRTYAAMVSSMDTAVGRIVKALQEHHYSADNTLIFFCSDNGGIKKLGSNGELREGKGTLYEGGVRVPAIAVWEGKLQAGSIVEEQLHIVDMFPTLLGLAGAEPEQFKSLDGKDVWATIAKGEASPHKFILHNVTPFHGAIRMGKWKLVHNGHVHANITTASKIESWELFDIENDPSEKMDRSKQQPEVFKKLQAKLAELANEAVKANIAPNRAPADFKVPKIWGQSE